MKIESKMLDKLNAFVDGELSEEERSEMLIQLDQDTALRKEVCDIHHVKELLHSAYPLNESMNSADIKTQDRHYVAMAASVLMVLALGFLGGYISSSQFEASDLERNMQTQSTRVSQQNKIIIYLGHSSKKKFTETLDKAEGLLAKYQEEGAKVFVVTSAGGIDLLRKSGDKDVQNRIKNMSGLYKSLHFVACNNQIYQLHKKGEPVNLVDATEVAPSAVQFVVNHLQKGWKYIAI